MRISFLGGGRMAEALIGGLLARQVAGARGVQVMDPDAVRCRTLESRFGVAAQTVLDDAWFEADVIVLAVKPQHLREAVAPLAGRLGRILVLSIAAGLPLGVIGRWLGGHRRLVRAMPNTPALVGAGVTGLYADPSVDTLGREEAERIMAAVGEVLWVEEEGKIDAITALSGSGPAYVFAFLEALQAAGEALGFDATTARRLAQATAAGAVRLAQESEEPLSRLRENVTSKGGTTEAALARLNERGFAETLREAVFAAYARSQELARQLGEAP